MDTISFGIYLRALWAVVSILEIIDMDAVLREARQRGTEADVDLILALRMVKGENHVPHPPTKLSTDRGDNSGDNFLMTVEDLMDANHKGDPPHQRSQRTPVRAPGTATHVSGSEQG